MQTIYLDISNRGVIPVIYAKQGDVGRKVEVILTNSGLPYEPEAGSAFSAWYSGSSGVGNYTDIGDHSAFSVSGNKVTVELITQMLQNAGECILCLVLSLANGEQIGLWNIRYICEGVPGAGSEPAKDYYTAFSQAVAGLAYPDASLSVYGKAADAGATGAAIRGITPAQIGALPVPDGEFNNDTNFDKIEQDIISWVNPWVGNNTGVHVPPTAGFIHTFWHNGQEVQKFYGTNGAMLYRTKGGEWGWENPPMIPGVEYRTTERWNGKVVYTKLVPVGYLPNNSNLFIEDDWTSTKVIRAIGQTDGGHNSPFPAKWQENVNGSLQTKEISLLVETWGICIGTNFDASSTSATIQLWYTKD